jgi:hypothetical protein
MIDSAEIISEVELEAARELMPVGTRIDECWGRERDLLFATVFIHLECEFETIFCFLRDCVEKRYRHIEFLWEFFDDFVGIEEISLREREYGRISIGHISSLSLLREELSSGSDICLTIVVHEVLVVETIGDIRLEKCEIRVSCIDF